MPIPGSSKRGSDVLFGDSNRFVNATSKRSKDVRECSSQPLEEYLEAVRHAKVSFRCGVEESVEIGAPTVLHRTLERLFKFNQDEKQKYVSCSSIQFLN